MRRKLPLIALIVSAIALAACADNTAPRLDGPEDCVGMHSGYVTSGGYVCP